MPRAALKPAALVLALLLPNGGATQETASRAAAETRLQELTREIASLQLSLEADRKTQSREQQALKSLDLDIQENARRLRDLQADRSRQQDRLKALEGEQADFLDRLRARHAALEAQILAAWRVGRESRLKLLLNQDSPARSGRLLAYYDYFNRAHAARINELREALTALDALAAEIDAELQRLLAITRTYEQARERLEAARGERLVLLEELLARIGSGQEQLVELERNRQDLETLLQRLDDALADIPADLGEYRHPGTLKGQLPMPVRGRVRHAFGQARGAGLRWQGWLVAANEGTEIRSIAYGRVAYADWLRGYGLLIIIDHGEGFMSLYGNNESLLFEVGDWVRPGAVIATVGRNPGSQGLYFELRNEGKAVDPAVWVDRS